MIEAINNMRGMSLSVGVQTSVQPVGAQGGTEALLPRDREYSERSGGASQEWSDSQGGEQIRKAVEELNRKMSRHSDAIFGIHEGTGRVVIKIVDRETKEVVRELPPEKTLDMISRIWEVAGIMVDEKR